VTGISAWICPTCGRRFVRTNQRHVCETWTVDDHLRGKPAATVDLYRRFVRLFEACGPFEYSPTKRQIGFQLRRIFAGVKLTDDEFAGWVRESYAVGEGKHLEQPLPR
jgi:hypothetical protein